MANNTTGREDEIRRHLTDQFGKTRRFGDVPDSQVHRKKRPFLQRKIWERISRRDLAVFSRQLALMFDLGVTILRALNLIVARTENNKLRKIIIDIGATVENGEPLSVALKKHSGVFGDYFVTAIRAGEESGEVPSTMRQLADYLDREDLISGKIRKAMAFPAFTLAISLIVIAFLLIMVIPTFSSVYAEAGVDLPYVTRLLIASSKLLSHYWWLLIIGFASIFAVFHKSGKLLHLKPVIDWLCLSTPIVRTLAIKLATFRFARITETMLNSGVSIMMTMKLAASATGNSIMKKKILQSCEEIDKGATVAESLAAHPIMPALVIDMIGIGEEVGAVPEVLRKVAAFYERDIDDLVANLTTAIEPLLTLFMGGIVTIVALSLFMPYFRLTEVILR
ncbi:type II secretion system F family protein [bacterium]|nr:type II secretion system F family protein [candidate division CSSED10-310 bacterium]